MPVTLGVDYAAVRRTSWWFPAGMGKATAIMTRQTLYLFPVKLLSSTTTTSRTNLLFTIGGRPPEEAIAGLVADPATTPEVLEQELSRWAREVEGPIAVEMSQYKRIRIWTGFVRRSVAFSKKESGYDIKPEAVRPTKEEMPAFVSMLRDRPGVQIK